MKTNQIPTRGVLYIAAGEKYIRAAIQSANSVRKYCPDLPSHLFSDWHNYDVFDFDRSPYPFTSVERIPDPHRRSKVDYLSRTPFDLTLYLDTDTKLYTDIREMFGILDRFDIALTHAHRRNDPHRLAPWRIELPQAFPQYNGGVILYCKTPKVIGFLEDWRDHFKEAGLQQDQMTLRELLWLSDLRIATLPPEYNVRFVKYHYLWRKTEAQTKIFHLRKYHDGPLWKFKKLVKDLGRNFLLRLDIDPSEVKKRIRR